MEPFLNAAHSAPDPEVGGSIEHTATAPPSFGAYVPFFAQLVRALQHHCGAAELDDVMRSVGRRLAGDWPFAQAAFAERVEGVAALLDEFGAPCTVETLGAGILVRGAGSCMLAEAVHGRPEVCRAVKSIIAELVNVPVRECCERHDAGGRCGFDIGQ